ncbi:hypothetical protein Tco_1017210 [Tanacetum coccineum]|uniref:Uncharacterized protein n=1 Tax=Tanacetum coccineum TaxID=301880 RepID=A0ABQ5FS31_9ASTR
MLTQQDIYAAGSENRPPMLKQDRTMFPLSSRASSVMLRNPNGNGNVVAAQAEGNAIRNNGNQISDLDEIKEVNANYILMANLQQASTSGTQTDKAPVYDSDGSVEIHKIIKDEIFPIVNPSDARLQNFEIQFLKEAVKFVRDFKSLANKADESLATPHSNFEYRKSSVPLGESFC